MLTIFIFILPFSCLSADNIIVPEGFVLQPLVETDGLIARPEDWFYSSKGTRSGWLWTISKEDPAKGQYETGLRIQLLVGVAKKTGRSREAFAQHFISGKRSSAKVLRDCPQSDLGQFYRECIEVLELVKTPANSSTYQILYSVMWGKELDMVVVSTFGAPPKIWAEVSPIADVMSQFRLIGPNFGK